MPHSPTTTRHLILSVSAYTVDVQDSGIPKPHDQINRGPVICVLTRPCPPCIGLALLESELKSRDEKHSHEERDKFVDCLEHIKKNLEEMLDEAKADIMGKAGHWEP